MAVPAIKLPEGFIVDKPMNLPSGFVLDTPKQSAILPQPTETDRLRQLDAQQSSQADMAWFGNTGQNQAETIQATKPTTGFLNKTKEFFAGTPEQAPLARDPQSLFREYVADPIGRTYLGFIKGTFANSPELANAFLQKYAGEGYAQQLKGKNFDEVIDELSATNRSGFERLLQDIGYYTGALAGKGKAVLPKSATLLDKAFQEAIRFGGVEATRQGTNLLAENINPEIKTEYGGMGAVATAAGAGAFFSALGQGANRFLQSQVGQKLVSKYPKITDKLMSNPDEATVKEVYNVAVSEGLAEKVDEKTLQAMSRHVARRMAENPKPDVVMARKPAQPKGLPQGVVINEPVDNIFKSLPQQATPPAQKPPRVSVKPDTTIPARGRFVRTPDGIMYPDGRKIITPITPEIESAMKLATARRTIEVMVPKMLDGVKSAKLSAERIVAKYPELESYFKNVYYDNLVERANSNDKAAIKRLNDMNPVIETYEDLLSRAEQGDPTAIEKIQQGQYQGYQPPKTQRLSEVLPETNAAKSAPVEEPLPTKADVQGKAPLSSSPSSNQGQSPAGPVQAKKEKIISAVVSVNGKIYEGENHGIAVDKAVKDGEVIQGEDGHFTDKDGYELWGTGWNDLFKTNTGRIIDRFQASKEFGSAGAEKLIKQSSPSSIAGPVASLPAQSESVKKKLEVVTEPEKILDKKQQIRENIKAGKSVPVDILLEYANEWWAKDALRKKDAWEVPLDIYQKLHSGGNYETLNNHRKDVKDAILRGVDVPANVLADYPGLKEQELKRQEDWKKAFSPSPLTPAPAPAKIPAMTGEQASRDIAPQNNASGKGEKVVIEGVEFPANSDGTVTVYHRTNQTAEQIKKTGWKTNEPGKIYVGNLREGQISGYGNNVIELKVDPKDLSIDDEFQSGEAHFVIKPDVANRAIHSFNPSATGKGGDTSAKTGKQSLTTVPKEWFKVDKLVDFGVVRLRKGTPGLPAGQGTKATRKSFIWKDQFDKVPVRLENKSIMSRIKELTDEVIKVDNRKGDDYYFVPKKIVEQIRQEFGEQWNKQAQKLERSPLQKLYDEIHSHERHLKKNNDVPDWALGEFIIDRAKQLGIPLEKLSAKTQAYIEEFKNAQAAGAVTEYYAKGVEQEISLDEAERELAEERKSIQEESDSAEIGDFLDGIIETEEKLPPVVEHKKDLLGRPIAQGGASGPQKQMFDKENFKTFKEQDKINAQNDIKGQSNFLPKDHRQGGFVNLSGPIDAAKKVGKYVKENKEGFYQDWFNRFHSIENLTKRAIALGAQIKPGENPTMRAREYLGIGKKVEAVLKYNTFRVKPDGSIEKTGEGLKPILDDFEAETFGLAKPEVLKKDLDNFLIAMRTIHDLQRPKAPGSTENIVTPQQVAQANAELRRLVNKYGQNINQFDATATRLYDYQKRVLHSLVDSGIMSQEMYDGIIRQNPHYIPFDRVIEDVETSGGTPVSKGRFNRVRSPIKKIKGSDKEIHSTVESVIKNTYQIMDRAERNTVAKSIAKLQTILPDEITPVNIRVHPLAHPKGNVIEYYEDGKRKFIEVSKNVYRAMTGLTEESAGLLVRILAAPTNLLRQGATLTPEFISRNVIRDQFSAMMNTTHGFIPLVDSARAIADIVGKSDVYKEWMMSGAAYSGFVELSRPALTRAYKELMKNPSLLFRMNIVTAAKDLSQLLEQATRVGAYKAAKRKGLSPVEAGYESREATVDFGRVGARMKGISPIVAFFNAGLQGSDRTVRAGLKNPISFLFKGLAAITIPSVILYLLNRDDPEYKEIPAWQKDLFWIFKADGKWWRVPKPFIVGQIFGSVPEQFMSYLDDKDATAMDKLKQSILSVMGSVSPISGDPASGLLPTAIKPIIEVMTNHNFFTEGPIVPESKQDLVPAEQYGRNTSETAKLAGKTIGTSPAKLEHLMKGYLGGSAEYILDASDMMVNAIRKAAGKPVPQKAPTEPSDIPLVKGFSVRTGGSAESVQKFYDSADELNSYYMTYRSLRKQNRDKEASELIQNHPELKRAPLFNKAIEKMSNYSKQIDAVIISESMSTEQKRAKIKQIEKDRLAFAQRMNEELKKLTK